MPYFNYGRKLKFARNFYILRPIWKNFVRGELRKTVLRACDFHENFTKGAVNKFLPILSSFVVRLK